MKLIHMCPYKISKYIQKRLTEKYAGNKEALEAILDFEYMGTRFAIANTQSDIITLIKAGKTDKEIIKHVQGLLRNTLQGAANDRDFHFTEEQSDFYIQINKAIAGQKNSSTYIQDGEIILKCPQSKYVIHSTKEFITKYRKKYETKKSITAKKLLRYLLGE